MNLSLLLAALFTNKSPHIQNIFDNLAFPETFHGIKSPKKR